MATGRLFQTSIGRDGFPMAVHEVGCHRRCFSLRTTWAQGPLASMVLFDDYIAVHRACHAKCYFDVPHSRPYTSVPLKALFSC